VKQEPLAEILRPHNVEDYVGQPHLMGKGAILRSAIETQNLHSMILWGPPGVGKTTLALLIAQLSDSDFYMLSAVNAGVKEIRQVIEQAEKSEKKAILFIDEIHRFSKSQQDSLLGAVERGEVTLIGATTENPSFEVISPLLSRCQVYVLKNLGRADLEHIIDKASLYFQEQFQQPIVIEENEALLRISGGDARKLLNAIELVISTLHVTHAPLMLNNEIVQKIIQKNLAIYDKKGENHYDIISAFIKSLRGSDPNAAVYWLARMLEGGEDPLFIARRMIILASEDIGNANPNALLLANNCFQAVHHIGMPEARIILSQTAVYLASSVKSNASYIAIEEAISWVKKTGDLPVPLHIRNAPTQLMKDIGYSKNYQYAHNFENNFVEQEFLPTSISGKKFYEPGNNLRENELRRYLKNCWKDKYKYIILLLITFSSFFLSFGQDTHYSQFTALPFELNPAFSGFFNGNIRLATAYRNQWISVTTPFNTWSLDFDMPLHKRGRYSFLFGLGANFKVDQAGDSKYRLLQSNLALSYIQGFGIFKKFKLGIGISGGFAQQSINYDALTFDEQFQHAMFDPNNPVSEFFTNYSYLFFDCGVGVVAHYSLNREVFFSGGVTVNHLNRPRKSLAVNDIRMDMNTTLFFQSQVILKTNLYLKPALLAALQGQYHEVLLGSTVEYAIAKQKNIPFITVGGGLFYRFLDAVIVTGSMEWNGFRLGISYDINLSTFLKATRGMGAFELNLTYIYQKQTRSHKGKENCPYDLL
jgi:putative ATPase